MDEQIRFLASESFTTKKPYRIEDGFATAESFHTPWEANKGHAADNKAKNEVLYCSWRGL